MIRRERIGASHCSIDLLHLPVHTFGLFGGHAGETSSNSVGVGGTSKRLIPSEEQAWYARTLPEVPLACARTESLTRVWFQGKIFKIHLCGDRIYSCCNCRTHLAKHDQIVSKVLPPSSPPKHRTFLVHGGQICPRGVSRGNLPTPGLQILASSAE